MLDVVDSNCNIQVWSRHMGSHAVLKNGSQHRDHMGTHLPVDAPAFNMLELAHKSVLASPKVQV